MHEDQTAGSFYVFCISLHTMSSDGAYHLTRNSPMDKTTDQWPLVVHQCLNPCHTNPMLALQKPSTKIDFYFNTRDPNSGCHTCSTDTLLMSHLPRSTIPWTMIELYYHSFVTITLTIPCDHLSFTLGIFCARHFIKLSSKTHAMANNRGRTQFNYTPLWFPVHDLDRKIPNVW